MLTGPRYYELAIKLAIKLALGGCSERTSSLQERALYDFDVRYVGWCLRPILVELCPCVSSPSPFYERDPRTATQCGAKSRS